MLTLLAKQQTPAVTAYLEIDTIQVKQLQNVLESQIVTDVISVKVGIPTITVYDDTKPPEGFIYVDGGLYNQEGLAVDALYYNTTSWNETWNGGYP